MGADGFDFRRRVLAIIEANPWGGSERLGASWAEDLHPQDADEAMRRLRVLGLADAACAELRDILRAQARLPKYELLRIIADAEAPGRVFAGRHLPSGREAAITIAPWSDAAQMQRFQRDARLLASLSHPHCGVLIDAGEARGWCHQAIELLEAPTLASVILEIPDLAPAQVVDLVRQFACGLLAQARAGVVHRLVTPAILRVPRGWLGGSSHARARVVEPGILHGVGGLRRNDSGECPYYLAPEQVRALAIDERTLVYNLGAVLHHALSGSPPFVESTHTLTRQAHLFEEIPDISRVLPDLGNGVKRLIATAMRKSPDERYASLEAFVFACDLTLRQLGRAPSDAPEATAPTGGETTAATVLVRAAARDHMDDTLTPPMGTLAVDVPLDVAPPPQAELAAETALPDKPPPPPALPPQARPKTASFVAKPAAQAQHAAPDQEITRRILAKHAELQAERGGNIARSGTATSVVSQSFFAGPPPRMDVVMGVIVANGWVPPEGQQQLREFLRGNVTMLRMRMKNGLSELLVKRGILTPERARELDATIADQWHFPHYRLKRLLGSGGSGRTYRALQIATGEDVAFKVFRQSDPDRRRRFVEEFTSFKRLNDASVARAIACQAEHEMCFAASQLVEGPSLAQVLVARHILPEAYAVSLARQILVALAMVHERSARCHLGLKPDNVLIRRDAAELLDRGAFTFDDAVVVTDFGMAAVGSDARGPESAWSAPELAGGAPGGVRSDIYALGAMLARMIAGTLPGADRAACDLGSAVNASTREAVLTATQRDANRRYADHGEFLEVLTQASRELSQECIFPEVTLQDQAREEDERSQHEAPISSRILRRQLATPKGELAQKAFGPSMPGLVKRLRARPPEP